MRVEERTTAISMNGKRLMYIFPEKIEAVKLEKEHKNLWMSNISDLEYNRPLL